MDLAYPESLWLLVVGARPPASQPRASSPAPQSRPVCVCGMSSLEILGWGHSGSFFRSSLENCHLTLLFSVRPFTPSLPVLQPSAHPPRKEKGELCDPWKCSLQTKSSQPPPCFVSSAILKSVFFGLSSVGFSQLWRCPDSQQSCWVTMPRSVRF